MASMETRMVTYVISGTVTPLTNRIFRDVGRPFKAPVSVRLASKATSLVDCLAQRGPTGGA